MSYRVSTQVYSGPFDLLLQLVTRQKVDIGAISISEVAEQYLAEVERIEALDLDVASDFLLVAATLLDIKAASLVPQEAPRKVDDDDDEFDEDLEELSALDGDALREVLIQRLIAYKQFKGAAAALGARMQAESRMHPRVAGPDPEFLGLMPDYLAGITLRGLAWGNAVGLGLCFVQRYFHVVRLSSEGYLLSEVPISLGWGWWLALNAGAVAAIVALLVVPTYIVSTVKPDESIRYE